MLGLTNCKFAFLDLETTGLSPWFGDRICEIGIVLTEGKRIQNTFQTLVNPQRELSFGAASINGLSDAELTNAPIFADVAGEVAAHLDEKVIVCHNARFDLQFLDSEYRRLGREFQVPNLIDTLRVAREHFEFPSYTLSYLAAEFSIQNPDAHRALADALTDKNIFFSMMESLESFEKPLEDFIGIYSSPTWPNDDIHLPIELGEAICSGKRLHITYIDGKQQRTHRWVTPNQVIGLSDYLYLQGYCHLRKAERSFRLDRIVEIAIEV